MLVHLTDLTLLCSCKSINMKLACLECMNKKKGIQVTAEATWAMEGVMCVLMCVRVWIITH